MCKRKRRKFLDALAPYLRIRIELIQTCCGVNAELTVKNRLNNLLDQVETACSYDEETKTT